MNLNVVLNPHQEEEVIGEEGGILKLIGHDGNIMECSLGDDKVALHGVSGMSQLCFHSKQPAFTVACMSANS